MTLVEVSIKSKTNAASIIGASNKLESDAKSQFDVLSVSSQCTLSLPSENIRKPHLFYLSLRNET